MSGFDCYHQGWQTQPVHGRLDLPIPGCKCPIILYAQKIDATQETSKCFFVFYKSPTRPFKRGGPSMWVRVALQPETGPVTSLYYLLGMHVMA